MNFRLLIGSLALLLPATIAQSSPPPLFGDWWYIMPEGWRDLRQQNGLSPCLGVPWFQYDTEQMYVPVNQPGGAHGGPTYEEGAWRAWYANCLANQFNRLGAPIALLIRNRNCPFPYHTNDYPTDPDALPVALDALPKLDYVLMDLETWGDDGTEMMRLNADAITGLVRNHHNQKVAGAYLGNYGDWAGERNEAIIWPSLRDRTHYQSGTGDSWDRDEFYRSHFNIAMPIAYPNETYSRHSDRAIQGDNVTPNDRAAIFWAPLERVSGAARNLPDGHLLIPWLTNYVAYHGAGEFYHAPPPSLEDLAALTQHIRMRGAASYMLWTANAEETGHPTVDYLLFRSLTMSAWKNLGPVFDSTGTVEYLNLDTNKRSGLQWSACRAGNQVWVLASNLHHDSEQAASMPLIDGLPRHTPPIPPGEHIFVSYEVNSAVRDFNGDRLLNDDDYIAFMTSLHESGEVAPPGWHNSVGGRGATPGDIDCNGVVDLEDIFAVSEAYQNGDFDLGNGSK